MKISRRALIGGAMGLGGALIPFPDWYNNYGAANAQTIRVRHSVKTAIGAQMLATYRSAVAAMTARGPGDPCSWIFQWYTHDVPDNTTKAAAIAAIPTALQPLAQEMWSTCQAHGGRPVAYFLPWHRMYVYFLERIVRQISGNPDFTLPYWDYFDPTQRALPNAFWSSTADALYRVNRNPGSNAGQPIDGGVAGTFTRDCLDEQTFLPVPGRLGMNAKINGDPHGIVHSLIGNTQGMGRVPWAANDPIFWLHHCNIDRMWASWNNAGRSNPTNAAWLDQKFIFADENCNRIEVRVGDFVTTEGLGYRYDQLMPVLNAGLIERLRRLRLIAHWPPPIPGPNPLAVRRPIVLGRGPRTVRLARPGTARPMMVRELRQAGEVRLALTGLQTNIVPGVIYDVYVGTPAMARRRAVRIRVGAISFFDAVIPAAQHHESGHELPAFDFNITRAAQRLGSIPAAELEVTITPRGRPVTDSLPVIADIQLFAG